MIDTHFSIDYTQPLLFLAIHNGHQISPHIEAKIGIPEADRLREEDPYTERFISDKANHIIQYTSRFEYDLNRHRDQAIYQKPDDCWGLPVYPTQKLTADEINSALTRYDLFYKELDTIIAKFTQKYDKVLVLDVHSYNHRRGGPDAPFDSEEENPEIILGTNHYRYMDEKWKGLVAAIEEGIRGSVFGVRDDETTDHTPTYPNRPQIVRAMNHLPLLPHLDTRQNIKFPGGFLSQYLNYKYTDKVCCIAIEFKKIWMNEWTGVVDETCFQAIKVIFDRVCEKVMSNVTYTS